MPGSERYRRLTREIREGFSILLRTPPAWGATVVVMLLWMMGGVLHVAVPILAGRGGSVASGVGVLLAATACGMVVGALALAGRAKVLPARVRLVVALCGTGASVIAFSLVPAGPPAAAAGFASGLFVAVLLVTTETVLQEAIPAELRGRVFALRDMAARIAVLAAAGVAGVAISNGMPPRTAVSIVGALAIAAGLAGMAARGFEGNGRRDAATRGDAGDERP